MTAVLHWSTTYHDAAIYEWDKAKAAGNVAKHKITFEFATSVFFDRNAIVIDTTRATDGEPRGKAVGMIAGKLYTLVFTWRGGVCRIISAGRANHREERAYGHR